MTHETRFRALASAAVLTLLMTFAGAVQAQTGVISGQVTDRGTGQPLVGAQVSVEGTQLGALTDEEGRFVINDVPAGERSVRVIMIGYADQSRSVGVQPNQTATADFGLETSAISLDAIVATVTGEQQRRELPNAIGRIEASDIVNTRPVTSMSDVLQARASGVNVLPSSGTTGTGSRIRIRGSNSVSLSNEPVVYVDGVRVYSDAGAMSVAVGGQSTSRLNDINPEDVESIEVVKGPSATTLYGSDAANGVIRIETKRGRVGAAPRWSFWIEQGLLNDQTDYPLNFTGLGADGNPCFAFQTVGDEPCEQVELQAFQPLEDDEQSPFGTGRRQQYGASVSGGSGDITYFLSGEWASDNGVLRLPDVGRQNALDAGQDIPDNRERPNRDRRLNLRANVGADVAEGLRLDVSTGYLTSDTWLPQNDNNSFGMVPSGLLGESTPENNDGWGFLRPEELFADEALQEIERFTGSLQGTWQSPFLPWLSARAAIGYDVTNRHDQEFIPVGQIPEDFDAGAFSGERQSNRLTVVSETFEGGLSGTFDLNENLNSRTSIGAQYNREEVRGTFTSGQNLTPGSKSVTSAAEVTASEETTEEIRLGFYAEEQIGWRDRVFVNGAIRFDDHSAFGNDLDVTASPKVGTSIVLIDDRDAPLGGFVNSLRLRSAWGKSIVAPGSTDALIFFDPTIATLNEGDAPGVSFGGIGNEDLKPETSQEIEAGFDSDLLDGRIGLELTWFYKETNDALIERVLAPSAGVSEQRFENIGSVRNTGIEVALDATVINQRNLQFEVLASGSIIDNKLLELGTDPFGDPIPPIVFTGVQRHEEGFPLGGFWDREVTFSDANDDGIITPDEITVADELSFIGNVFPERELSISPVVTLFDRLRLSALFDHRGDFYQYNNSEEFRCGFTICEGLNNPDASLFEQARALHQATAATPSAYLFIEEADFWKLRELSATFFAPDEWARAIGAAGLNLTVTGRNLATWTDYTGLDPELNQIGQDNFATREFLTAPPIQRWNLRINATF